MIISSWNVNSVRARIENIKEYIKKFSPDVLMMQEIKTPDDTYPYDDIKSLKYENYVFGQKSYNGVAIISKKKLSNIKNDIFKDKLKQSRIITADVKYKTKNIQIINIYTPNGNPVDTEKYDYKIYWLDSLIKTLKKILKQNENIIIGGDFNIIPAAEDVHNPKSYENDALFRLTNSSLIFLGPLSNLFLCLLSPGSLTPSIDFIFSKNSDECLSQSFSDNLSGDIAKINSPPLGGPPSLVSFAAVS